MIYTNTIKTVITGSLYLGFCLILFLGCERIVINKHIKELSKENSLIGSNGWEIIQNVRVGPNHYVSLMREVEDTLYLFGYTKYRNSNRNYFYIEDLVKSYYDESFYYEMALINNDTLYFFRYPKSNILDNYGYSKHIQEMEFYIGKYYYQRKFGELNSNQTKYFDLHKDSLIKIRGNTLPNLPELDAE